ncbi:hypothetical protein TSOC_011275 [Tetrabaena socialis]|uniref:DNA-directed RNA polymerase n=1 Tax=Tetrabaena socialis TaxID=47790 RepID=A0A2J7ZR22_9CHLO|nr:hypothetical protein TSOC_011275 [Tetrabaena socialis]|eukprot:PNH02723.1 hypothetical protein TSOC_011275 [Tetrabaena socialis]
MFKPLIEVNLRDTFVEYKKNGVRVRKPVPNGLYDSRMGPADAVSTCGTCHKIGTACPGHYGYVALAKYREVDQTTSILQYREVDQTTPIPGPR